MLFLVIIYPTYWSYFLGGRFSKISDKSVLRKKSDVEEKFLTRQFYYLNMIYTIFV